MSLQKFIGHNDIMKLISLYAPLNGEDVSIYTIRGMLNEHDEYLKAYMDERLQNNQHIRASDSPVLYVFNETLSVQTNASSNGRAETKSVTANRNGTIRVKVTMKNNRDAYGSTVGFSVYVNDVSMGGKTGKPNTATEYYHDVNISKGDIIKVVLSCGTGIEQTAYDIKICGTLDLGSTLFEEVVE